MGILFFLLLFFVVMVFLLLLPTMSGIGSFEIDNESAELRKREKMLDEQDRLAELNARHVDGYAPPDEYDDLEESEKKSRKEILKEKLDNISIPISFKTTALDEDNAILRRRRMRTEPENNDPNVFDYDLDDIIKED